MANKITVTTGMLRTKLANYPTRRMLEEIKMRIPKLEGFDRQVKSFMKALHGQEVCNRILRNEIKTLHGRIDKLQNSLKRNKMLRKVIPDGSRNRKIKN